VATDDEARDELRRSLQEHKHNLQILRGALDTGEPTAPLWTKLRTYRSEADVLLPEVLAYVQGYFMRGEPMAAVTELADALLGELAARTRVRSTASTLLGTAEYVNEISRSVRVPFTSKGIWNLPVTAHEFGHILMRDVVSTDGWEAVAKIAAAAGYRSGPSGRSWAAEHIADVLAVLMIGPAYPLACIYLRFDPSEADLDWPFHPSALKRLHVMLRTFEKVHDPHSSQAAGLHDLTIELRREWAATLIATNPGRVHLKHDDAIRLDRLADSLTDLLLPNLRPYDGWAQINHLRSNQGMNGSTWAIDPRDLPPEIQLWDVVNAAWLNRLQTPMQEWDTLASLGHKALELCLDLVQARRDRARQLSARARNPQDK
jgi:hypothetical protein